MEGFDFVHRETVRFRDVDSMGHVNNAVFLTYIEEARIAYLLPFGAEVTNMILARVEIDYRSPLSYGEALDVTVRCASMRRSSFVLEFKATERAAGRLVAEARKVLVHYDYGASRSLALPPELRDLLKAQDPDVKEEATP